MPDTSSWSSLCLAAGIPSPAERSSPTWSAMTSAACRAGRRWASGENWRNSSAVFGNTSPTATSSSGATGSSTGHGRWREWMRICREVDAVCSHPTAVAYPGGFRRCPATSTRDFVMTLYCMHCTTRASVSNSALSAGLAPLSNKIWKPARGRILHFGNTVRRILHTPL